eukprot:7384236-Prymnesium_polylepis.3
MPIGFLWGRSLRAPFVAVGNHVRALLVHAVLLVVVRGRLISAAALVQPRDLLREPRVQHDTLRRARRIDRSVLGLLELQLHILPHRRTALGRAARRRDLPARHAANRRGTRLLPRSVSDRVEPRCHDPLLATVWPCNLKEVELCALVQEGRPVLWLLGATNLLRLALLSIDTAKLLHLGRRVGVRRLDLVVPHLERPASRSRHDDGKQSAGCFGALAELSSGDVT